MYELLAPRSIKHSSLETEITFWIRILYKIIIDKCFLNIAKYIYFSSNVSV